MEVKVLHKSDIDKDKWEDLMDSSATSSIYTTFDFISSIYTDFQAIVVEEEEQYLAVMPLRKGTKLIFTHYLQPILAKYWGIVIRDVIKKNNYESISYKRDIIKLIIENIPKNDYFVYNHHPAHDYLLPYHWKGYEMHTKYTFRLDLINKDYESIRANEFEYQARADINKAIKNNIRVEVGDIDDLIYILEKNNLSQKVIISKIYHENLKRIYKNLSSNNIVVLKALHGDIIVGACMIGFHGKEAYYMYSNLDPEFKKVSPLALLTEEAIKISIDRGKSFFDFVGMMEERFEFYWRKFGANPVTYIQIRKTAYPLLFK